MSLESIFIVIGSLLGVVALAAGAFYLFIQFQRKKRRAAYPRNKVVLHQFPRGLHAPSASPFALKLECWLRMAGIPYENDLALHFSTKGQVPWITYNEEDICDSHFCIEYLSKKFEIDLNKNLTVEQRAISRAFLKLNEESLRWHIGMRRYVFNPADPSEAGIPTYVTFFFGRRAKKALWYQGYGRHSEAEVLQIGREDLKSINDQIGTKKYLMSNEPCDVDASLFGFLAQFVYQDKGPLNKYIKDECPNILRFVSNIKETYWKDWDQCLNKKPSLF